MYTIPKELITDWDKIKTRLVPSIDKVPDTMCPPAEKRQMKAQLTGLLQQFDQGLKAKIKVAANAKADAEARKAAQAVFDVAGEYSVKLKDTVQACPPNLQKPLKPHFSQIEKVLQQIKQHALASAKSRPPITFTNELDEIAATFAKGAAEIKSAGKAKYKLDKAQQTSLEKYFTRVDLLMKPAMNAPKQARSEIELYTKLGEMSRVIETYRTKDLPDWLKKTTMPKSAAELPKRLDTLFATMRTNTDRLIKELKAAMVR